MLTDVRTEPAPRHRELLHAFDVMPTGVGVGVSIRSTPTELDDDVINADLVVCDA
jgi:hypothetical protein